MESLDKRKLNLLVHLAKIDGKYERSERELIKLFAKEKGLSEFLADDDEIPMRFTEFTNDEYKIELLYWSLKLVQADQIIHDKELLFCKNLAVKLGFKPDVIKNYVYSTLPSYIEFEKDILSNWLNTD